MDKRPACEQVTITHGGNTVALRPSLRAAVTLVDRYGFPALLRGLDEGSFTVIREIILSSGNRQDAAAFLLDISGKPLSSFIMAAREPLFQLVAMFMPAPNPNAKPTNGSGKPVKWSDFYADLFQKATGWLEWTPKAAWNATPTEIDRAFTGYVEKLKAIHGSGEDNQPRSATDPDQAPRNAADGLDPEFDRAGLRALKAKIAGRA